MKHKMAITIYNPETPEGMNSDLFLNLEAEFRYIKGDYGNGHWVRISGDGFSELIYDIRYDITFHRASKQEWLKKWAECYWSGKNGAYAVKSVKITKQ